MENLKQLNESFFELYGRVYANKKFLTDKQYKYICSSLFSQYGVEYKKFVLKNKIDNKTSIFSLKRNAALRIPFRFLFFSNRIAKIILKDIKKDFKKYCKEIKDGSNN